MNQRVDYLLHTLLKFKEDMPCLLRTSEEFAVPGSTTESIGNEEQSQSCKRGKETRAWSSACSDQDDSK